MPNLGSLDLSRHNTLALPCRGSSVQVLHSVDEAVEVLSAWGELARPLVIGCGSNLVLPQVLDEPVIVMQGGNVECHHVSNIEVMVVADAGVIWDELVAQCAKDDWRGIENLSLIPGTVGAAPVQNIGAYGVELKDCLSYVEVFDFEEKALKRLSVEDCAFGYRDSIFKRAPRRYVVLRVALTLRNDSAFTLSYGELKALSSESKLTVQDVRDKVIAVRQAKLPDPNSIPNAGSFFKNPVVSAEQAAALSQRFPSLVQYPVGADRVKLAAGWLIDQAGWKGYCAGRVGIHARQALVIVNLGGATQDDVIALAKDISASVFGRYGVELEIEPVVV